MIGKGFYIKALKSTWMRRIINDNDSKWKILLENIMDTDKLLNYGSAYSATFNEQARKRKAQQAFIILTPIWRYKALRTRSIAIYMNGS